jgi:polyhydroxyalkanoate synthesis regulator phasin
VPGDELFKRYLEVGASVLGMSRERSETIVRDLVASGEVAKGQATKAADWLVERGRSGSEEVAELIRREIRQQVTALGLATRDDVAGLRAEIDQLRADVAAPAPAVQKAAVANPQAPAAQKVAVARRPPAGKAPAKQAPPAKQAAPAKKAAPAQKAAPARKAASVAGTAAPVQAPAPPDAGAAGASGTGTAGKRSRPSGPSRPGAAPPAGGADPAKG